MKKEDFLQEPWSADGDCIAPLASKLTADEVLCACCSAFAFVQCCSLLPKQMVSIVESTNALRPDKLVTVCSQICRGLRDSILPNEGSLKSFLCHLMTSIKSDMLKQDTVKDIYLLVTSEASQLSGNEAYHLAVDVLENRVADSAPCQLFDDFIVTLLKHILVAENININDKDVDGVAAVNVILDKISSLASQDSWFGLLLQIYSNVELDAAVKTSFMGTMLQSLSDMELDDIIFLAPRLLQVLASQEDSRFVCRFLEIINVKSYKEKPDCDLIAVMNVQATVIRDILSTVRDYPAFGKSLLTFFRSAKDLALCTFYLACLISLCRVNRLRCKAREVARKSIEDVLTRDHRLSSSGWLQSSLPQPASIGNVLETLTGDSPPAWVQVAESLCDFAFYMLDTLAAKPTPGRGSVQLEEFALVKLLIVRLYQKYYPFRPEIVERIIGSIMKLYPCSFLVIDIFKVLLRIAPMAVLDCGDRVISLFSVLSALPLRSSVKLMKWMIPVVKLRPHLRTSMFKMLRSAVFAKNIQTRMMGVNGLLLFLNEGDIMEAMRDSQMSWKSHEIMTFSSQCTYSAQVSSGNLDNMVIFIEMMGSLRKALHLQGELRRTVYLGLARTFHRECAVRDVVLRLLYRQLSLYLPADDLDGGNPLRLRTSVTTCNEKVVLMESMGTLMSCVNYVLAEKSTAANGYLDLDFASSVEDRLMKLVVKLSTCELADFNLDKTATYAYDDINGTTNIMVAHQLLNVIEAALEFSTLRAEKMDDKFAVMFKLCSMWTELDELLKERLNLRAQKRKAFSPAADEDVKTSNDYGESCAIQLSSIVSLLSAIFENSTADVNWKAIDGEDCEGFISWLFLLAQKRLTCLQYEVDKVETWKSICTLARLTLTYAGSSAMAVDRFPSLRCKALVLFSNCVEALDEDYRDKFPESFSSIACQFDCTQESDRQIELSELVYRLCVVFMKLFVRCISDQAFCRESDEKPERMCLVLLGTVDRFLFHIPRESPFYRKVFTRILETCEQQTIAYGSVTKKLWKLALGMSLHFDTLPEMVVYVAEQFHCIFGDVSDGTIGNEPEHKYASLSVKTAPHVLPVLLTTVESMTADAVYAIRQAKMCRMSTPVDIDSNNDDAATVESSVCDLFGFLLLVWHELVQCRLPSRLMVPVIRGLEKFFKALTLLAKHYLAFCLKKCCPPAERFQKVTKRSGTHLIGYVYKVLLYSVNERKTTASEKTLREMNGVPALIYAVECYEETLIQLSAKCKMNFMIGIKASVSRDFRIATDKVRPAAGATDAQRRPSEPAEHE